jgi:hypothetical protein
LTTHSTRFVGTAPACQVTARRDEEAALGARGVAKAAQARSELLLGGDGVGEAAATQDAAALTLGGTTPDPVVDVVLQRVLQARLSDGALGADLLSHEHTHAVIREEDVGRNFLALPPSHPISIHCSAPFSRTILRKVPVGS